VTVETTAESLTPVSTIETPVDVIPAVEIPVTPENDETPLPVTDEPTIEPTRETSVAEPTAEFTPEPSPTIQPVPLVRYTPAQQPVCKTTNGLPENIASGGFLDYDCQFDLHLSAANLDAAEIELDWTVRAAPGGWTVQLKPPATDAVPLPEWTDLTMTPDLLRYTSRITGSAGVAVEERDETLQFGLRLHRPACAMEIMPIGLGVAVKASVPALPATQISQIDPLPLAEPFQLKTVLAPVPEPILAFSGSLNFGDVAVDAFGVRNQPAPQSITVVVSNLDQACGTWELGLQSTSLGGEDGSTAPSETLLLASVNETLIASEVCPLQAGCVIALVSAGPGANPEATYTLGISLVLPDQLRATTFNSTLTATMTEAAPS